MILGILITSNTLLILLFIYLNTKTIMATQAELAAALAEVTATVAKIGTETTATLAKVAELETALANAGTVSPEVQAAFDALKEQVGIVDGLVPDAVPPTE